jgi:hypothetical protein
MQDQNRLYDSYAFRFSFQWCRPYLLLNKGGHVILKVIPWDVWAALAIAVMAVVLAVVFNQSPLLVFFLVALALCAYIAMQFRLNDHD